jgi:hypothetical protein
MTKEQYLIIKQKPEIPMEIWFEYYRERGGELYDFGSFTRLFSTCIMNKAMVNTSTGTKQITLKSALTKFYEYYDKKFDI